MTFRKRSQDSYDEENPALERENKKPSLLGNASRSFKGLFSRGKNDYDDYAVSVDSIEEWTGFDFFANLSESLQTTAESNTSVSSFSSFR